MTLSTLNPDPNARRNIVESLIVWGCILGALGILATAALRGCA